MIHLLQEIILDFQHQKLFTGIKRDLKFELIENKAFVCIGVRRAGKTTFLYQIIDDLLKNDVKMENILYINFFDDRLTELKNGNLNLILEAYYSLYPFKKNSEKIYFFFDELQEITNWEPFIDRLLRTENCDVFITGSSAKMLSKEIATQMRGRSITWELFPFSFTEFLKYKEIDYLSLTSKNRHLIQNAFHEYFQKGGFPEVRKSQKRTRIQIHQEYYKSILLRDVVERYDALHPQAVMHAGFRLVSTISSLYSINRLTSYLKSMGFKISKDFVASCTQWFEDVYFLFSMKIFNFSVAKQNVNAKKIYCIDHGLADSVSPGFSENKGLLLENIIFTHIRRQTNNTFYYRTRNGHEVDFLFLDKGNNHHLVQACFSLNDVRTKNREIKALTEAMKELSLKSSTIVTMDMETEIKTDSGLIQAIPAWKFLIGL